MITVVNGKNTGFFGPYLTYIGRKSELRRLQASPLANPFPMAHNTQEERERVVKEFEQYLLDKISSGDKDIIAAMDELQEKHDNKEILRLVCYCAPKLCHGEVIKELIISGEYKMLRGGI